MKYESAVCDIERIKSQIINEMNEEVYYPKGEPPLYPAEPWYSRIFNNFINYIKSFF